MWWMKEKAKLCQTEWLIRTRLCNLWYIDKAKGGGVCAEAIEEVFGITQEWLKLHFFSKEVKGSEEIWLCLESEEWGRERFVPGDTNNYLPILLKTLLEGKIAEGEVCRVWVRAEGRDNE